MTEEEHRQLELGSGSNKQEPNQGLRVGDQIIDIPLGYLQPNPHQPRRHFSQQGLQDLARSIKEKGVQAPIQVRKISKGTIPPRYEIIAGERRYRASQLAGKTHIPAIQLDVSDDEALARAAIENMQREDLIFLDELETVVASFKRKGSSEAAALELGVDRKTVDRYRKIHGAVHLTEEFEHMFDKDATRITYTVAMKFCDTAAALAKLKKGSVQERNSYGKMIAKINNAIERTKETEKNGGIEKSLGALKKLFTINTDTKGTAQANDMYAETDTELLLNIRLKKKNVPPENALDISASIRRFVDAAGITV
jgi:ParB family chromosome partitioning protein